MKLLVLQVRFKRYIIWLIHFCNIFYILIQYLLIISIIKSEISYLIVLVVLFSKHYHVLTSFHLIILLYFFYYHLLPLFLPHNHHTVVHVLQSFFPPCSIPPPPPRLWAVVLLSMGQSLFYLLVQFTHFRFHMFWHPKKPFWLGGDWLSRAGQVFEIAKGSAEKHTFNIKIINRKHSSSYVAAALQEAIALNLHHQGPGTSQLQSTLFPRPNETSQTSQS